MAGEVAKVHTQTNIRKSSFSQPLIVHYFYVQIVNFGTDIVNLKIVVDGLEPNSIHVIPKRSLLEKAGEDVEVAISPHSLT
ncbi:unnamed protein product [Prunus armeniaca]|uniref:Uncharacterized protein n=1 Tax=Prunus armeniaca TaxID=36596 RepID=A0A6J5XZA4_PRUAR|nr:unnamed protein product [Prunus armeniaca]